MLISLLVAVIVMGLVYYCITLLPIPQPFKNIAIILLVIICILWLLGLTGVFVGPWGGGIRHCP